MNLENHQILGFAKAYQAEILETTVLERKLKHMGPVGKQRHIRQTIIFLVPISLVLLPLISQFFNL